MKTVVVLGKSLYFIWWRIIVLGEILFGRCLMVYCLILLLGIAFMCREAARSIRWWRSLGGDFRWGRDKCLRLLWGCICLCEKCHCRSWSLWWGQFQVGSWQMVDWVALILSWFWQYFLIMLDKIIKDLEFVFDNGFNL